MHVDHGRGGRWCWARPRCCCMTSASFNGSPRCCSRLPPLRFSAAASSARRPLARRMLESVFKEPLDMSRSTWTVVINLLGRLVRAAGGREHLYRAQLRRKRLGELKVFGISAAMLVFMIPQVVWLRQDQARSGRARRRHERRATPSAAARNSSPFAPVELEIEDESHLHVGHAGSGGGAGIFAFASWRRSAAYPRYPGIDWSTRRSRTS